MIAHNYLNGMTVRQIAEAMTQAGQPVHYSTVAREIQRLKGQWNRENVQKVGDLIAVETTRLDVALNAIMPAVRQGDLGAVKYMLEILDRRLKLYGLDSKAVLDAIRDVVFQAKEAGEQDPYAGLTDSEAIARILDRSEARSADGEGTPGNPPKAGPLVN